MHDMLADEAVQVATHLLDETGAALMTGDFSRFAPHFALPQSVATIAGARWLETESDIRVVFDAVVGHFHDLGVARLVRHVETALFDGEDVIHFSHLSHLHRDDGALARPVYPSLSRLVRQAGTWRVEGSQYSVLGDTRHSDALLAGGRVSADGSDPAPTRPSEAVFQSNLDAVTRAYLTNDAALLERHTQLPLFMQKSRGTQVFATRQEQRANLARYATEFQVHGVTDIVRKVRSVQLVGERRMHGTYRTHMLRGIDLLIPAYVSAMTLEQGEDLMWPTTSVMHPMGHLTIRRVMFGEED